MAGPHDPYGDDSAFEPIGAARKKEDAWRSSVPSPPGDGEDLNLRLAWEMTNDHGNGQRLISREGLDLLYILKTGWAVWDNVRWSVERGEQLAELRAYKTALAIKQEIAALDRAARDGHASAEARIGKLAQHAVQSGNVSKIRAMLDAAAAHLCRAIEEFDQAQMLVTAQNATIELGKKPMAREVRRADLITRSLGVRYDESAECPRFEAFLERIMPDDEMRGFLQRSLGYCLTGSMREQVVFLFYGLGRNGKSTLMSVMRHVFGDYHMHSPINTFLAKREGASGGEASPDLARLPGARLVSAAEPPAGARLDESKVKEMTGGEAMTVRHLNQGFFTFDPTFKVVILTNHRPNIRGADEGIWRRIRLVPFTEQIRDDEVNKDLGQELLAEGPGILNWLLDGVAGWMDRGGLAPPAAAIAAVEQYRADQDPVGEFLSARIVRVAPGTAHPSGIGAAELSAKQMRNFYKEWCEEEGLDPLGSKAFGERLTMHRIERRKSHGVTIYVGVIHEKDSPPSTGGGL